MRRDDVWAITSYFNPMGYRRRRENYGVFRRRLGVPLVAVELAGPHGFELGDADADVVVRVPEGAVVWQKERLLTCALAYLPPSCVVVAWVDCDVVFGTAGWAALASAALDRAELVHLFDRLYHLHPGWDGADGRVPRPEEAHPHQRSMVGAIAREGDPAGHLSRATARDHGSLSNGMAWAARREVIEAIGFYDGCIIGGGDTALACAAYGCPEVVERVHAMNAAQAARYRPWAARAHAVIRGGVEAIDADLFHLWHGDLADRRGGERHAGLAEHAFDPSRDVALNRYGVWEWATDKPRLHAYVRGYFADRHEDGRGAPAVIGASRPDRRVLIVRHPEYHREFYDIVLQWVEANLPEIRGVFEVRDLPARDIAWDGVGAHHAWVQDPVQMWSAEAYARLMEIAAACDVRGIPVINRVDRLTHAAKSECAHRLAAIGIRTPRMARIRDAAEFREMFCGLRFPMFVRDDWGHALDMRRADTPEQARAIDVGSFRRPVAVEIVDVRDPRDGLFRKYRYFACGGHGVSHHLMVTEGWISRGEARIVTEATRAEELAYIDRQDPNHAVLQRARLALDLEFVAFDYGVTPEGEMVVWEANPFPLIVWSRESLKYRNIALHRTIFAMVRMYLDAAGIAYPEGVRRMAGV